MILSSWSRPRIAVWRTGVARRRRRRQHAERDPHVDALEVVLRGAADLDVAGRRPPRLRDVDHTRAREELTGERLRHALDVAARPLRPISPPGPAAAGP